MAEKEVEEMSSSHSVSDQPFEDVESVGGKCRDWHGLCFLRRRRFVGLLAVLSSACV